MEADGPGERIACFWDIRSDNESDKTGRKYYRGVQQRSQRERMVEANTK